MSAVFTYFAVGLNLGSAGFHLFLVAKYHKRITEEQRGYRQSGARGGSKTGAIRPAGGGTDGASAAEGIGASPSVVETEILAERAWQLSPAKDGGVVLFSASHCVSWEGPTLRADRLPEKSNTNGIYAVRELRGTAYETYSVTGTVALSGRVIEGERGYRAEQATIRSLRLRFLPQTYPAYGDPFLGFRTSDVPAVWADRPWEVAEQLAARYQCDCTIDWLPTSDLPAKELRA